jgi:[ribosomal protein S18]-alanine N-acetyltransferase
MKSEVTIETITPDNHKEATVSQEDIADFLHEHLDRFRDPRNQIMKCLDYALGKNECRRGFIMVAKEKNNTILGVVVTFWKQV